MPSSHRVCIGKGIRPTGIVFVEDRVRPTATHKVIVLVKQRVPVKENVGHTQSHRTCSTKGTCRGKDRPTQSHRTCSTKGTCGGKDRPTQSHRTCSTKGTCGGKDWPTQSHRTGYATKRDPQAWVQQRTQIENFSGVFARCGMGERLFAVHPLLRFAIMARLLVDVL